MTITELFGYAASLGVLVSFLMKNIRVLRIVNTAGCVLFIIYGVMVPSWPVVVTNAAIVCINAYYLIRDRRA
jgi:hypothetical protein